MCTKQYFIYIDFGVAWGTGIYIRIRPEKVDYVSWNQTGDLPVQQWLANVHYVSNWIGLVRHFSRYFINNRSLNSMALSWTIETAVILEQHVVFIICFG